MIEWLEPLGYEAVRQKVVGRSCVRTRAWLSDDWKTLCRLNNKRVPVSNQERIRQRKERDGLHFPFAALKVRCLPPLLLLRPQHYDISLASFSWVKTLLAHIAKTTSGTRESWKPIQKFLRQRDCSKTV